jgi:glycosyltransferase involved in cell wall biosynthesis
MPDRETAKLSVVMPVYNEKDSIGDAVREIQSIVLDAVSDSELIVINDGSTDSTKDVLEQLAILDARVLVISQANGGHGAALRTGMEQARGEYMLLVDSDRQIPIEAFSAIWAEAQTCDMVMGIRVVRHDPPTRIYLTKFVRQVVKLLFGVSIRDANVPFKVLKRSLWLDARSSIPEGTLAPSLFLAIFALRKKYNVVLREVPHRERQSGVSSIRHFKLFRFCSRAFGQLLRFRNTLWHE